MNLHHSRHNCRIRLQFICAFGYADDMRIYMVVVFIIRDSEVIMFSPSMFVITRDSEVIMFSPCVFVSLCVCASVYVCHDVCLDDLTMKDWCHTNNILQVHCWGCLVAQLMFHALMTSLMTSQGKKSRSNFEIDISPPIFELQCWSKAENVGKANGYFSGIFNFRYHFRQKICCEPPFWKFWNIKHSFNLLCKKCFSWWWRHWWRHRVASMSALYIP